VLEDHRRVLRSVFPRFAGQEIETVGDGFLVEFSSAVQATECAVALHQALAEHNGTVPEERRVRIRIGIHVGDVVVAQGRAMGDAVNIAARIEPLAEPGGICLSGTVYDQVRNKLDLPLIRLPNPELKNITVPLDVYRVALAGTQPGPRPGVPARPKLVRTGWLLAAVGLAGALALAAWLWPDRRSWRHSDPAVGSRVSATLDPKRVVVFPFESGSQEDADVGFARGLTEALRNKLSQVPGLRIIDGTLITSRPGPELIQQCQDVKAGSVLRGTAQRSGNQLRISVSLVHSQTAEQFWSHEDTRELTQIFAVQSEVAAGVAAALSVQLLESEKKQIARPATDNPEAYALYLQGRHEWNKFTEASFNKSIQLYREALAKDPGFALAYSAIADSYLLQAFDYRSPKEVDPLANDYAQRALKEDPHLAEAHVSMAMCHLFWDWDCQKARQELEQAVLLKPRYADAHHYFGHLFDITGSTNSAAGQWKEAWECDPLSAIINTERGWSYLMAGRLEEAVSFCDKALALDNGMLYADLFRAQAMELLGHPAEALQVLLAASRKEEGDIQFIVAEIGCAQAQLGRLEAARQQLAALEERSKTHWVDPWYLAFLHMSLGEKELALRALERAYEVRSANLVWLGVEPKFRALHGHPEFTRLQQSLGFQPCR
jgi:adenylate cyclase